MTSQSVEVSVVTSAQQEKDRQLCRRQLECCKELLTIIKAMKAALLRSSVQGNRDTEDNLTNIKYIGMSY